MILVLLGPPGAGKGTQGDILARRLGVPKIATGDLLRAAAQDGTELGIEARSYMDRGQLVPDSVILGIMKTALESPTAANGAILDGVVRTVPQALGIGMILAELGRKVTKYLLFEVPEEELIRRLSSRTVCSECQTPYKDREPETKCDKCGGILVRRKDDEPEAIRTRLRVYQAQTEPVLEWCREHEIAVAKIDAVGSVAEITERTMKAIAA